MLLLVGKKRVAAEKLARSLGITMTNECAWIGPPDKDGFTPFRPDSRLDNIYLPEPSSSISTWYGRRINSKIVFRSIERYNSRGRKTAQNEFHVGENALNLCNSTLAMTCTICTSKLITTINGNINVAYIYN
jgi:hypothetical protein